MGEGRGSVAGQALRDGKGGRSTRRPPPVTLQRAVPNSCQTPEKYFL